MFKKILLASLIFGGLSISGGGAQSNSIILQAISFIILIISLVVIFIFMKTIKRSMGCLPSLLILAAIVAFLMHSFGMFNNGIYGIPDAIQKFLGQKTDATQQDSAITPEALVQQYQNQQQSEQAPVKQEESAAEVKTVSLEEKPTATAYPDLGISSVEAPVAEEKAIQTDKPTDAVQTLPPQMPKEPQEINLLEALPMIGGTPKVFNANTLSIRGNIIKLYAIDAPDLGQTCANMRGEAYNCGKEAAQWLNDWLDTNYVECRIMQQTGNNNFLGVCTLGDYDIAAALVNAGLAFALRKASDVYVPYENQAKQAKRGLWRGSFYMPWDWRKIQKEKPKIKIIKPKKKGILDLK